MCRFSKSISHERPFLIWGTYSCFKNGRKRKIKKGKIKKRKSRREKPRTENQELKIKNGKIKKGKIKNGESRRNVLSCVFPFFRFMKPCSYICRSSLFVIITQSFLSP